uniref:Uncharacterized protein n=1 Tax=Utricularia reniformis TaxID=192314 RepID=A0A1Y0B1Z4_9LAMI|nr:hypothetical protein AEK19_MT1203 [Utricularia reniformis]ART31417.1 hypothetical protein AEK19_MT1203 [Utricularia reniformis]
MLTRRSRCPFLLHYLYQLLAVTENRLSKVEGPLELRLPRHLYVGYANASTSAYATEDLEILWHGNRLGSSRRQGMSIPPFNQSITSFYHLSCLLVEESLLAPL